MNEEVEKSEKIGRNLAKNEFSVYRISLIGALGEGRNIF